jgi:hypothetical protein
MDTQFDNIAPIALFTFKRYWHLQQTVESLKKNSFAADSELFIFRDGPRSDEDLAGSQAVREFCKTISGFKSIIIHERARNMGLARSIITGVTELINKYGRVIVLEDDMVTSPHFLRYMNEALNLYRDEDRVISIHGYNYPAEAQFPETFFLRGADCWGWATWKRGWDLFESNGRRLLDELKAKNLTHRFDFNGSYGFTKMLEDQVNGKNDSWAIRWHASAFLLDKLTLYPGKSLVHNIGIDKSGTHCTATDIYDTELANAPIMLGNIPIEENKEAFLMISHYLNSIRPPIYKRVIRSLKKRLIYGN